MSISDNSFDNTGLKHFLQCLKKNHTIKTLKLGRTWHEKKNEIKFLIFIKFFTISNIFSYVI
jgi:hypothetical protein